MYFDEWFYGREPFTPFEFRMLAGDVAYVALHSFMYPGVVGSFEARLPALRRCAGVILDLRSNHGGNDSVGYGVAAHFLRRPTAPIEVRTQQHNAGYRAAGVSLSALPGQEVARLDEGARTRLRCYRHQWFHEESWGRVEPAEERLDLPVAVLTSSETGSAAEDFSWPLNPAALRPCASVGPPAAAPGSPSSKGCPGAAAWPSARCR
jgi:C-terminal processing protease CtpA/Prc